MKDTYRIKDSEGRLIDATLELSGSTIVLHSRSGSKESGARNAEYAAALRIILEKTSIDGDIRIEQVHVDSSRTKSIPIEDRIVFSKEDRNLTPKEAFSKISRAIELVGQKKNEKIKGNRTKRIQIKLDFDFSYFGLEMHIKKDKKVERLSKPQIQKVNAEHIWTALRNLQQRYKDHGFPPSADDDIVLGNGERLPLKVVFGLAATEALGFEVLPENLTGGLKSACRSISEKAGFQVLSKDQSATIADVFQSPDERRWAEGKPKLVTHLVKERARGLAEAKKTEFKRMHGRLYCEHCPDDFVEKYGALSEACIEVHHKRVGVKDMSDQHLSKLSDLECLCANCHKIEHARLSLVSRKSKHST